MKNSSVPQNGRVVAFIDIGTNSVRLLVVRLNSNHSYTILTSQKQQVRLGEGEFEQEELQPEAMERVVMVCRRFKDLAGTFSCEEFVAVSTSAMREAENRNVLLNRLRHEAQLDVRVISGREEARLIYMGVASGTHLSDKRAFFIDIGGGSTEFAIGGERQYKYLESVRLGAIRLSNQYFGQEETGPVPAEKYRKIQQHVRSAIVNEVRKIKKIGFDIAIGSSGTIINLAEIASRTLYQNGITREDVLTYRDLKKVVEHLCSLPLDARRKVPGINPERADIIVAGSAILEAIMKELKIEQILITNRGLQDGLLADYISRMDEFPLLGHLSTRQRSVLQLARSCGINESHARTVTILALELFDSAKSQNLHALRDDERELLEYGAFLHDIGSFISYTNHHAHSFYIVSNAELLGFDHRQIGIIANIAKFHRKRSPHKKIHDMTDLDTRDRDIVKILSMFLRLAESFDRSHAALVRHVRFTSVGKDSVNLDITAREDCQLEIWGVENEKKAFFKIFGKELILDVKEENLEQIA